MQDAIENQDLVLMEDSTMKQEELLTAGTFINSYSLKLALMTIQNAQPFISNGRIKYMKCEYHFSIII